MAASGKGPGCFASLKSSSLESKAGVAAPRLARIGSNLLEMEKKYKLCTKELILGDQLFRAARQTVMRAWPSRFYTLPQRNFGSNFHLLLSASLQCRTTCARAKMAMMSSGMASVAN